MKMPWYLQTTKVVATVTLIYAAEFIILSLKPKYINKYTFGLFLFISAIILGAILWSLV